MASCFKNNVFLCFLPAHTSHGLQPLDNGVFSVLKNEYRKSLTKLNYLTNATPVNKIGFLRCYISAREKVTSKHIKSSWRVTGNWPISRRKALFHPEIQQDKVITPNESRSGSDEYKTPITSRYIVTLADKSSPTTQTRLKKHAKAFDQLAVNYVEKNLEVEQLKSQLERLQPKRRRKVPNPNKRFIQIGQILSLGQGQIGDQGIEAIDQVIMEEEVEEDEVTTDYIIPKKVSRSGREIRAPARYNN
jgi:hypothetical protein